MSIFFTIKIGRNKYVVKKSNVYLFLFLTIFLEKLFRLGISFCSIFDAPGGNFQGGSNSEEISSQFNQLWNVACGFLVVWTISSVLPVVVAVQVGQNFMRLTLPFHFSYFVHYVIF